MAATISSDDFYRALKTFRPDPHEAQRKAVEAPPESALFVVAGPGSGKTASLTLRILKLLLVDGVPARGVLATTFTVKAAAELRSRILGWGFKLIDALKGDPRLSKAQKTRLEDLDINQVWTGTLDSLCEQLLRDHRAPGTQPPVLADEFVARTLLLRQGLFNGRRDQDPDLSAMLLDLHSSTGNTFGFHIGTKANLLQSIWDRRYQDLVDWDHFLKNAPQQAAPARPRLAESIADYAAELQRRGMVDFALLEFEVLQRLKKNQLSEFTEDLRVVLVDEYQDTNLLQEQIYFELAAACGGAICVVGDDDQSLYRFRGATVDLFRDFAERYRKRFKRPPEPVYLTVNYRSTQNIVKFVNGFATLDRGYQQVRVKGKPELKWGPTAPPGRPVLGMFRETREELADDLADFIHAVFRRKGFKTAGVETIVRSPDYGDLGDCAILCSSPAELASDGKPRLPRLLRERLAGLTPSIQMFNPRGQDLAGIETVSRFGGLLAECIDPGGVVQAGVSGLSNGAVQALDRWRAEAVDFATGADAPTGLLDYARGWADRDPAKRGFEWPRSVSVINLIYGLVHFLPELHDDPEGQVYLEVFTRQLAACEQVGAFKGRLVHDPSNVELSQASVKELLRDFLGPIASGTQDVDEDLIGSFPRDRLSVLSIHQSKGLEFPITIVDVGSDFRSNHPANAFKRFPSDGSTAHRMEDLLRPHTPLGPERRGQIDRAFDDLIRQYFVAFSRPQDVLLLVGLRKTLPGGQVQNIATGWDRQGVCHWRGEKLPFVQI